jgi:hypothetical protein
MMEYEEYEELDPNTKLTSELVEAIQGHVLRDYVRCFEFDLEGDDGDDGCVEGEAGKGYYTAWASIEICEGIEEDEGKFFVVGWVMGREYKKKAKTLGTLIKAVAKIQDSIWEDCMSI